MFWNRKYVSILLKLFSKSNISCPWGPQHKCIGLVIYFYYICWYRQQTMQVKWGTNYSSPFTVTNGVRQGGVLSPYLFAVYLDELSTQLGSARVGCTVGNMVMNHLMFADDVCVFSPSISGPQCLLNIGGDYAAEHKITFNCNKTIGVLFCPKKYKQPAP